MCVYVCVGVLKALYLALEIFNQTNICNVLDCRSFMRHTLYICNTLYPLAPAPPLGCIPGFPIGTKTQDGCLPVQKQIFISSAELPRFNIERIGLPLSNSMFQCQDRCDTLSDTPSLCFEVLSLLFLTSSPNSFAIHSHVPPLCLS